MDTRMRKVPNIALMNSKTPGGSNSMVCYTVCCGSPSVPSKAPSKAFPRLSVPKVQSPIRPNPSSDTPRDEPPSRSDRRKAARALYV